MTTPVFSPYTVGYNPTTSIVGNGISGQVVAEVNPNGYSWRLISNNLPGLVKAGIFPNPENGYFVERQVTGLSWPYRGGYNLAAQQPARRTPKGTIAMTAVGIAIFGPESGITVIGRRGSIWNINAVTARVFGEDQYSGSPDRRGEYHYTSSAFITNNAWSDISGFTTGYTQPDGHSKLIGWAADGYPIYGPYGYSNPKDSTSPVVRMRSGYEPTLNENRPANPILVVRGTYTNATEIQVKNAQYVQVGLRLLGSSLPGEVKVLRVDKTTLTLDTPITIGNGEQLQGDWPLGIFVEDYLYYRVADNRLDRYNGRFCVTPEYPDGTYAYFATQDTNNEPTFPYFIGNQFYGSIIASAPPAAPGLVWVTENTDLGTIAFNQYFSIPITAVSPGRTVLYEVIAGSIPGGTQVSNNGIMSGVPELTVVGNKGQDVTSKFVVRAYTTSVVNGVTVVDQFKDKTFTITIAGRTLPQFVTPAGQLGSYYDGSPITPIQIEFTDILNGATLQVAGGSLPPGLTLSPEGLISGYIIPAAIADEPAGYDLTPEDAFGYDFLFRASNFNYQFTLEVTNGRESNLRTFEIYVISRDTLTADTTIWTADNTLITADESSERIPFLTNPEGSIGTVRDDNFFAYQFTALDLDGQAVEYVLIEQSGDDYNWSVPQGLVLDPLTGWLYGIIPAQGLSERTYTIAIRVRTLNDPTVQSKIYLFTLTVISGIDKRVTWITPHDLGQIVNGSASLLKIEAVSPQRENLSYRLTPGSKSLLPQGLTLLPSGLIAGNCSYATFTLDNGTTTFDVNSKNPLVNQPTTWDLTYRFFVNAYSPTTQEVIYSVSYITIQNGGSGYTSPPTVTIAPPDASGAPAIVESVFVNGGKITGITLASYGFGYLTAPVITVTGGGPFATGAILTANLEAITTRFLVSENREFVLRVIRKYNEPLNTLYIEALPPIQNRELLENLTQNPDLLPPSDIFRLDDPNFGVSQRVVYAHAYGLIPAKFDDYVRSLQLNHYWKQLTLGEIKTAQATDSSGNVIYEVIYSEIIDNLVNGQGQSVGKEVELEYPITYFEDDSTVITTVYPNSLDNMRTQVIDQIGSVSGLLPLWMTSFQENKRQLGFVPAWVIAYVKPGTSKRLSFKIQEQFGINLNRIDFEADRYVLDAQASLHWDPIADSTGGRWSPPPAMTTFDLDAHYRPFAPDGSTELFYGGMDYQVGSKILIKGSDLNGIDGTNDLTITVNTVDENGTILGFFLTGIAPYLQDGVVIYNVSGTTIEGTGIDANFDIIIGTNANTRFDGGSMLFIAPVDIYGEGDTNDKYLVFPKRNIIR